MLKMRRGGKGSLYRVDDPWAHTIGSATGFVAKNIAFAKLDDGAVQEMGV